MSKNRTPVTWSKAKTGFVINYVLMYPEWLKEYRQPVTARGVCFDKTDKRNNGSSVERIAIRKAALADRIQMIEDAAAACAPGFEKYLIMGCCEEGVTYEMLEGRGIPCCRNTYFKARRRFLALICQKILGESIEKR